jgi:hypothetical protein
MMIFAALILAFAGLGMSLVVMDRRAKEGARFARELRAGVPDAEILSRGLYITPSGSVPAQARWTASPGSAGAWERRSA